MMPGRVEDTPEARGGIKFPFLNAEASKGLRRCFFSISVNSAAPLPKHSRSEFISRPSQLRTVPDVAIDLFMHTFTFRGISMGIMVLHYVEDHAMQMGNAAKHVLNTRNVCLVTYIVVGSCWRVLQKAYPGLKQPFDCLLVKHFIRLNQLRQKE